MKFNCSQYFNKNPESELCLENIQLLRKVPCLSPSLTQELISCQLGVLG